VIRLVWWVKGGYVHGGNRWSLEVIKMVLGEGWCGGCWFKMFIVVVQVMSRVVVHNNN
jgi:hypothetical protein